MAFQVLTRISLLRSLHLHRPSELQVVRERRWQSGLSYIELRRQLSIRESLPIRDLLSLTVKIHLLQSGFALGSISDPILNPEVIFSLSFVFEAVSASPSQALKKLESGERISDKINLTEQFRDVPKNRDGKTHPFREIVFHSPL